MKGATVRPVSTLRFLTLLTLLTLFTLLSGFLRLPNDQGWHRSPFAAHSPAPRSGGPGAGYPLRVVAGKGLQSQLE